MERASPPLVGSWTDAVARAAEQARQAGNASVAGDDAKAFRRQWLDSWGRATETYLRSPDFQQLLKTHLDSLIATKRTLKSAAAAESTAPPTAADANRDGAASFSADAQALAQGLDQLLGDGDPTPTRQRTWATASEVVYQQAGLKLLHFCPREVKYREPVLICFALVNRPYILDLKENRSVVRQLLNRGFDVYLIDWAVPDESDAQWRLEDYICTMLDDAVREVCKRTQTPQLNLLGYCMGGTMSTLYTALFPDRVRNLILMAAPIDFEQHDGLLNLWARPETFDVDGLIEAFGNCPGEFLQFVFQLMKPVQNFAEKQLSYLEKMDDSEFLADFETLERWSNDSVPVAGATFRDFVSMLYQQNRLVSGQMSIGGRPIRLDKITCPLLLLVAQRDHLVPPSSTLAIEQHVGSQDVTSLSISAGHVGLAVGSQAQRTLWPQAADWIANHSTEQPTPITSEGLNKPSRQRKE